MTKSAAFGNWNLVTFTEEILIGKLNFCAGIGRNNASPKSVAICYFSQPIYCHWNFLIEQHETVTLSGWPKTKVPFIRFGAF